MPAQHPVRGVGKLPGIGGSVLGAGGLAPDRREAVDRGQRQPPIARIPGKLRKTELVIDAGSLILRVVAVGVAVEGQMQFVKQPRRKGVPLTQQGVLRAARNTEAVARHGGVARRSGEGLEQVAIREAVSGEDLAAGRPEVLFQLSVELVQAVGERWRGYEIRSRHGAVWPRIERRNSEADGVQIILRQPAAGDGLPGGWV